MELPCTGNLAPDISEVSAAATSVTIMWTQPQFSREVTSYTITVSARDNILESEDVQQLLKMIVLPPLILA